MENTCSPAFVVQGLTYRYGGGEAALDNVRVTIPRGEATAVLGLSGSGKSTLLAILGRLIECPLANDVVTYHSPRSQAPLDYAALQPSKSNGLRRHCFGFIMQSAHMLANFSCRTNIEMPLTLQGLTPRERDGRLEDLLDRLRKAGAQAECRELKQRLSRLPSEISTGQRQRMAVLRALIHDPEVVFADEPCSNLDPHNADQFRELLASWLAQPLDGRRTLVLVTHNAREAWQVASRIGIVERHGIGTLDVRPSNEYEGPEEIQRRIIASGLGLREADSSVPSHLGAETR